MVVVIEMEKLYMGIDIGSVMVKGIIIDEYDNIITSSSLYVKGDIVNSTKDVLRELKKNIDLNKYQVVSIGVTGRGRKLIGILLDADVIKNEITTTYKGVINIYPNARTILEIGGQEGKIINILDGKINNYDINSLCSTLTGSFLDKLCEKINIKITSLNEIVRNSKNNIEIIPRCSVFAENDLLYKIQEGYSKEDIANGVCLGISKNYVNNVIENKKIKGPIIFIGGVSKVNMIAKDISGLLNEKIIVPKNSLYIGAIGVAIMSKESKKEHIFHFNIDELNIETRIEKCMNCSNKCGIVTIYRNNKLIDYWGNKCDKGMVNI